MLSRHNLLKILHLCYNPVGIPNFPNRHIQMNSVYRTRIQILNLKKSILKYLIMILATICASEITFELFCSHGGVVMIFVVLICVQHDHSIGDDISCVCIHNRLTVALNPMCRKLFYNGCNQCSFSR